jgi:UDPglucose--hexose-1-phosphate uridylyltransferase
MGMYDWEQAVSLAPRCFQFTGEGSEHALQVYPIIAGQILRMKRMNQLRWHALLQEWVLVAAHRQGRPQMPNNECPFCPGSGRVPPEYDVHLYPNDFAAFRLDNSPFGPEDGLFATTGARGVTDVVLYHPSHNLTPAQLSAEHWRKVIALWTARYQELAANPDLQYVYIFENAGPAIGVTMPHPHGQIYGFPFVPSLICRELRSASEHYSSHGECLYCRLLHEELADGRRIVIANANFAAFVPFAARFPAELQICARRHLSSLPDLLPDEADDLAELIKLVRMKYDNLFGFAMPLMMILRHPPVKGDHPYSHFHIDFYPVQRSATKLKYLAGVETGAGVFLGDTVPEDKARELRETEPLSPPRRLR